MRVSLHCRGCAGKVKKHLSKMEGAHSGPFRPIPEFTQRTRTHARMHTHTQSCARSWPRLCKVVAQNSTFEASLITLFMN